MKLPFGYDESYGLHDLDEPDAFDTDTFSNG